VQAPASDIERAALRKSLREKRAAIPATERIAASTALLEQLEAIPEFLTDINVAGYWAVAGELPLAAIIGGLRGRGQVYHLPVIDDQKRLRFAPWWPGMDVAPNRFGIPEPASSATRIAPDALELVFVPLLAFDRRGHRLGMGAGYYDRTFAFLATGERPREPLLVGVAYAFQEIERVAHEPHDVRLDFVATERELIECVEPGDE